MFELLLIILILISGFSLSALFYALRRINQYEAFIRNFQQIIEFSTERMKNVDASGHYESDDETGFFFEQLKQLQLLLNGIFEEEDNIEEKE